MSCTFTVFDSMVGTVVVTVETIQTRTVMFPLWFLSFSTCQVSGGANLGTDATSYTAVTHYMERFVCYKDFLKECS